ncbi:MAG: hypothetical protein A2X34_10715 [Elusimicrobia bacterium GWC2_51_8]|nr:MAG: hypothetical protein A2X33_09410 [Elusimicrobia bacterium GWA2_51_34]OGR62232.1 MAG: hypothetical protein A2X34_10715 [Elusimicrobia bacterium GWC2_51_8]OGR88367.1 MAG: hypothetical protein A2021_01970 [Elusimicrobia bacterium GWF2_52_66]HAF94603.1 short-chain dehydrogenase [Elusimicrobiota bacterium]HCE98063.1 short-chain dehydrogenase [Elusimicrobiota bacterium]
MRNKKIIIISASSDIGTAMCRRWRKKGLEISGTYRTESAALDKLRRIGVKLVSCDLQNEEEINEACSYLKSACPGWDALILCPGTQSPIGSFIETDFGDWEKSVKVNLISQLNIVRRLLPDRNKNNSLGACVLFFAGGGTNTATVNYSAYTVSKIALIKMCELLDAEIHDSRFAIVGPGWVETKIHNETLKAGKKAGNNYAKAKNKLLHGTFTPMNKVLDCCDWIINSPREIVSGRNFSVVSDMWGDSLLSEKLKAQPDMYKLRRNANNSLIRKKDGKL